MTGSNTSATVESGESTTNGVDDGGSFGRTVWYKFNAVQTGNLTLDTIGSTPDTVLNVYTGDSLAGLTFVTGNDQVGFNNYSRVTFPVVANNSYMVQIGGKSSASGPAQGSIKLNWLLVEPQTNDNFANALEITGFTGTRVTTNVGATVESGEPVTNGVPGGTTVGTTLWYKYVPFHSKMLTLSTTGSDYDTVLALYTGPSVDNLTLLSANNDETVGTQQSKILYSVTGGQTYFIQVGGFEGATGNTQLNWSLPRSGAGGDLVNPASGNSAANTPYTLASRYVDLDGGATIPSVRIMVNRSFNLGETITEDGGLIAVYDVVNNKLYLKDDAGTGLLGGFAPGSANVISNSHGSLNCASTVVQGASGNFFNITWSLTPAASFQGTKGVYLYAEDYSGLASEYSRFATWTIGPAGNAPVNVSLDPSATGSLTDAPRSLVAVYGDTDGNADISRVSILVNSSDSTANALGAVYDSSSNKLYLLGDDGTTLLGGFAPGSNNTITNSQGSLHCATTTVNRSGDIVTVGWSLSRKSTFTGTKNVYMFVQDNIGNPVGWTQKGQWLVKTASPNVVPGPTSLSLTSPTNTGVSNLLAATYFDDDGALDMTNAQIIVNNTLNTASALNGVYDASSNKLYLRADNGSSLLGGFAPGSNNTITNSQGSLNCATTTVTRDGKNLRVTWSFTPAGGFTGFKNVYLYVRDLTGAVGSWTDLNDWIIKSPSNTAPVNQSLSPSITTSMSDEKRIFRATYFDANGNGDIAEARLLRATSSSAMGLSPIYDATANLLYLSRDGSLGGIKDGGFAPGSANVITGTHGKLYCADTTVERVGNTLTVNFALSSGAGTFNVYSYVKELGNPGLTDGWDQMGSWLVKQTNAAPQNTAISPVQSANLVNTARSFRTVYSDPNGNLDIASAQMLINSALNPANALAVAYDPVGNKLYLKADNGTTLLGGFAPGSDNTISNSQGSLNCAATTVTRDGESLTINWNLTPSASFTGLKNVYLYVRDGSNAADGWDDMGDWWVKDSTGNTAPVNVSLSPVNGTSQVNQAYSLTSVYEDADHPLDINSVQLIVNGALNPANALAPSYDPYTNRLYLKADDGVTLLGGFEPGSSNTISNSQGSLDCAATTVDCSGNTLTMVWSLKPASGFLGTKNVYSFVRDAANASDGWDDMGDWTITIANSAPVITALSPANSVTIVETARTFRTTITDAENNVNSVQVILNSTLNPANALAMAYDPVGNRLYLKADDGVTLLGGYAPGSSNIIFNSQGSLNCANSSVIRDGNKIEVLWNVTPEVAFAGLKNVYVYTRDSLGLTDGWKDMGDWLVKPSSGNSAPVNVSVDLGAGSSPVNQARTITSLHSDADSALDLTSVQIIINSTLNPANALAAAYDPQADVLYLKADNGTTLLGGFKPGSNNTITNSQGTLNCAQVEVTRSGNNLTIAWNFTPSSGFSGTKNIYTYVRDSSNAADGWDNLGTWVITTPGLKVEEPPTRPSGYSS